MKTINSTVLAIATLLTAGSLSAEKEASKTNTEKITLQERAKHVALGSLTGASAFINLALAAVAVHAGITEPIKYPLQFVIPFTFICFSGGIKLGEFSYRSFAQAFRKSPQPVEQKS